MKLLFPFLFCLSAFGADISPSGSVIVHRPALHDLTGLIWNHEPNGYSNITFNVYYSTNAVNWALIGSTTNQAFTATNLGWYAVTAKSGEEETEAGNSLKLNGPRVLQMRVLRIGL